MDKFAGLPDISLTQPDRLIKYRVSEDRFTAEVLLPGFAYTDFDQKIGGKVSFWSLAQLFQSVRWEATRHGLYNTSALRDGMSFLVSQYFELGLEFSEMTFNKCCGIRKPLRAIVYLSHLGTSTLALTTELFDVGLKKQIGLNVATFVYIDKNLRRPSPLPFFKGADKHLEMVKSIKVAKKNPPNVPDSAFVYTLRGEFSDEDGNGHITQSTYTRWCSDAASVGAKQGKFKGFDKAVGLYPLKSMESHFSGEVFTGEKVSVFVWEDPVVEACLHFAIKKGTEIVFFADIVFYGIEQSKL